MPIGYPGAVLGVMSRVGRSIRAIYEYSRGFPIAPSDQILPKLCRVLRCQQGLVRLIGVLKIPAKRHFIVRFIGDPPIPTIW